MIRRPPRSTRTDTLFPSTTLFRSLTPSSRSAFVMVMSLIGLLPSEENTKPVSLARCSHCLRCHGGRGQRHDMSFSRFHALAWDGPDSILKVALGPHGKARLVRLNGIVNSEAQGSTACRRCIIGRANV